MEEQEERLKQEIVAELRAGQIRFWRNAVALASLALLVGCTVALHPLIGGIVAGALGLIIAVLAMVMSREKRTVEKETDDV
ncbi:MAG: hypothetical protein ACYTEX_27605 [Planctomycetota bacterium]|jgi:hypothetical protein